jgi:hypothetical protein
MVTSSRRIFTLSFLFTLFLTAALLTVGAAEGTSDTIFSSEKAGFTVRFNDETSPYRVMSIFVLPLENLVIGVQDPGPGGPYSMETSDGIIIPGTAARWSWQAPDKPGLSFLRIIHPASHDSILLNVFVMVPYDRLQGEELNGYRFGKYPTIPLKQLPIYRPPRGFIEVTEENLETPVSPHFQLKDFICKQDGDYPKYLVLKEKLLLKLELILEKVNEQGISCRTFHIMSGYRTPYYNKLIGNVKYSRHLWGGAADIFIDENPEDGMMDDLNGDGQINFRDAGVLYDIIDRMYGKPWYQRFLGGLGRYEKSNNHGPFVHVDVRGFRARWGN